MTSVIRIGVVALALAACTSTPSPIPTPPLPPVDGLIVTVRDVRTTVGSMLAVIVYDNPPGDDADPGIHGIGGFAVPVTSDHFSATETVRAGTPLYGEPSRARPNALVPDGSYRLIVYVSSNLGPYGEWIPASPVELACMLTITVDRTDRHPRVTGLAPINSWPLSDCARVSD